MSRDDVRRILGSPTQVYPGEQQWTYQRFMTFGYVNILFDTNGTVLFGHYEEF